MPNLKTLTKELRQEIVSYLYPLPSIYSNLVFRLAIQIFTKTSFSSHINFISRCLQHKVIPKGFRSNFHASIFSNVSNFNLKYLHEIQRTQNTFSHNIMRSTIRAMCSKRNELNKQIIECRSQLSNVCPSVLLLSIHSKIQALNSKLFHHLEQTKRHKFENLTNPRKKQDSTSRKPKPSHRSYNSRKPTTFKRWKICSQQRPQLRSHIQEKRRIHYQTRCRKISSLRSA